MKLVLNSITGPLPTHIFHLLDDQDHRVGLLQIRVRPSKSKDLPEDFASHIYYEIGPTFRGLGYGKKILRLGLVEAKKLGLNEIILTVYDDNIQSKAIIEANGGKLADSVALGDKKFLKYIIRI